MTDLHARIAEAPATTFDAAKSWERIDVLLRQAEGVCGLITVATNDDTDLQHAAWAAGDLVAVALVELQALRLELQPKGGAA